MEGLSAETADRDRNSIFRGFCPFLAFDFIRKICDCVFLQGNFAKCNWKNETNGDNAEIISINEIYIVSISVYFIS
jgi:hypothetical protein